MSPKNPRVKSVTDSKWQKRKEAAGLSTAFYPDFGGPFTRGEASERARVLSSSSHPHLQEHGEHPTI
jgi:hypothetical protein